MPQTHVLQAIRTKYHGPTNTRGARYSATCWGDRVIVAIDHALSDEANHLAACEALKTKLSTGAPHGVWDRSTVAGRLRDNSMAHVFVE